MPGRVSSPAFIGRRVQLDLLRDALAAVEQEPRRVALVHGEAGIGKTRLLDEFCRSVVEEPVGAGPARVLRGACLELGGGELPYAPILDVLDALGSDPATADQAVAIRSLRDELGGAGETDSVASGRGRIFLSIRDLIVGAARETDVVVCIDDLQWADRSTLELLTFLSTRLAGAPVLLVLAYRSDEMHRRHPLRPVLAELERAGLAADVDLVPLGPTDVSDQLEGILGAAPDQARLERIVTLADGNPFHVEELAALDVEARELPRSLRDVLLARLDRLDEPTLDLLGRAAVVGRDVDERLLVAVSQRPEDEIGAALRQAIDHHVLEPLPGGHRHRFRHALLREAVFDDLLSSERTALHRRIAEVLDARPELAAPSPAAAAAELAYHWSEADDPARAFPALLEAGRRAQAAHAWTEASEAFERAERLAASGIAALEPIERAELGMRSASLASFAGDLRRGLALARAAVAVDDGAYPSRSGVLLSQLGTLASDAGDFDLAVESNERAIGLIPPAPPSVERVHAIGTLAARRMISGRCREAIELADEAIGLCRAIGVDVAPKLGAILTVRAISTASLGREAETSTAVDESIAIYRTLGDEPFYDSSAIAVNDALALYLIARFDDVLALVDEAMDRAARIGATRGETGWLEPRAALAAFTVGDWHDAAVRLERFRPDAIAGFPLLDVAHIEALIAAAHGDRPGAMAAASFGLDTTAHNGYVAVYQHVQALAALWVGDPRSAVTFAESALATISREEDLPSLIDIVRTTARACADLAEQERASRRADDDGPSRRAMELAELAADLAAGTYQDDTASTPWMRAIALQVDAEAARAGGTSDPDRWEAAGTALSAIGTMPEVAYCRYRQGEALLIRGDRVAATTVLTEARAIASRVGMTPLLGWIDALARRGRLAVETRDHATDDGSTEPVDVTEDPWGLSRREREVLALVAEGRTNREIGDALFISDKTASVHVTHILDKLGVSSRTEAALLAGRSGIAARDGVTRSEG